jgi:hypothetical protein
MMKLGVVGLAALAVAPFPLGHAAAPRACLALHLAARAAFEGGAGAEEGGISLRNRSTSSCQVAGRAILEFVAGGRRLGVRNVVGKSTSGARRGRAILLTPGDRAFVHARWSNWCGDRYQRVGLRVWIQTTDPKVPVKGTVAPPRCDDPSVGSRVAVGPFERIRHYP